MFVHKDAPNINAIIVAIKPKTKLGKNKTKTKKAPKYTPVIN